MEEHFKDQIFNINNFDCSEEDFILNAIGYNDFHFIKPLKLFRIQKIYTLHYILSGSGYLDIYGKKFKVNQYDMFFIPPNESFRYYPDENNLWTYIWFDFSKNNSLIYAAKMGFSQSIPISHCENYMLANKIIHDLFGNKNYNKEIRYYESLSVFYKFLDAVTTKKIEVNQNRKEQIIKYIECHYYDQDLCVDDICHYFSISHSYMCKIFKGENGIKKLIIITRINEAKKLLLSTDLTVAEIGYSVGYIDNIHFMKAFKKTTGMTANEYRKKY